MTEIKYLEFPVTFPVVCFDIPTGFSGKIHALLSRPFDKGRDWYDLIWYLQRNPKVNKLFIKNAFNQQGPWAGENIDIDKNWVVSKLHEKIKEVNFENLKKDVSPFIKSEYQRTLEFWNASYFEQTLKKWQL